MNAPFYLTKTADYWEERAQRYATQGQGLAAVCSYGMPWFYNQYIEISQKLAVRPWLRDVRGRKVLDVGCGIGRWSNYMAAHGAEVTGADLSPTMVAEAQRRSEEQGLRKNCRFIVSDLTQLNTGCKFSLILGVTVLQHILDEENLALAIRRLSEHLEDGGTMILVEAAPDDVIQRCDTPIFKARTRSMYLREFENCGLELVTTRGLDPTPLKSWFLPYYKRLPRPIALAGLAAVTAFSLPVDAILGRRLVNQSWHKLFVLKRPASGAARA